MANNTQGSRSSEYKPLTVLYPPKKVWVSISESAWSSSVTLTCSSDGNPPVQNYTWFKEGGGSPVGSGLSYSAVQSGSYYCVAQNTYGSQTAAAVPVTLEAERSMVLYVGVGVGLCVVAAIMAVVVWLMCRNKKKRKVEEHDYQNTDPNAPDDTYTALHPMSRSSDDVYHTLATVDSRPADDVYTALDPQCRSPEYDTLAVSESTCTDDCFGAPGRSSRP
ncbi:B-cell receptor CD22-like [Salminus brasiliensis]|uniref:B-cell receptor CD22-like n=1 Tax=Salminus brasiliensis TaxID=930266 RepID=UPI003B837CD0